jgi:hypothetical protein
MDKISNLTNSKKRMIDNRHHILIEESPENIFQFIDQMPNKFPVYKLFETRAVFFIRMLLLDGRKAAKNTFKYKKKYQNLVLKEGDQMGPFLLSTYQFPNKYFFTLNSFFFNCQTGYVIKQKGEQGQLNLDLISENPSRGERIWWFFVKPIHNILSRKVLREIKKRLQNKMSTL